MQESEFSASAYDRVYDAVRPEIFFKSLPEKVVSPGDAVGSRSCACARARGKNAGAAASCSSLRRETWMRMGASCQTTATGFSSVPIPEMVMRTESPASSVNESGGTIPAPVSRTAPCGNACERNR